MNIPVFEVTVPQFILSLSALKDLLKKGYEYADSRGIDMNVLFQSRLAPDQFPLGKQVQIACDVAKFCASRLTGVAAPSFEDDEKSLNDYVARIDTTIEYLRQFKPEQFQGYERRKVTFPWYPGHFLDGHNYLVQHALPNFYFHVTTAYGILRFNGVELGKKDYLGSQNWKAEEI
jgi:hypothetical protein